MDLHNVIVGKVDDDDMKFIFKNKLYNCDDEFYMALLVRKKL